LFLLNPVQLNLSFVRTEAINSEPTLLKEYILADSTDADGIYRPGILSAY